MDTQKILSVIALVVGALVLVLSVGLLGTPVTDIGMISTVGVFILLGVFGLLLGRQRTQA